MWNVQLFELDYDHREEEAVLEVLRSRWITMGEKTLEFESKFASFLGLDGGTLAVSSATASLHMALMAMDIGEGDEVIVPALTFVSDFNVIRRVGARPVLADCCSLDDWTIDPASVEDLVNGRTRAIMVVHYGGYACDMDAIMEIADRHGLYVIEDAAHAPGATLGKRPLGTLGHVGCFSFFTNKNLSVGEGGMYVTRDERLYQRGRNLRSQGMSTMTLDRHKGRSASYDVIEPGLNYRLDEMRAALGLVQLDKLPRGNERRRHITGRYRERLSGMKGVSVPFSDWQRGKSSYHIMPVLLAPGIERTEVIESLKARGIQSSIHYPAPQQFSAYSDMPPDTTPRSSDIAARCLTLPLYPGMTDEQVDLVCSTLTASLE